MTAESASSDNTGRLPWTLVGASLVAMTAHYFTADGFLGLPMCAVLLLAGQVAPVRLPRGRSVSWSIRAIVATVITVMIGVPDESVAQWYMKPEYTKLLGCLLAAEIAIRAWERPDPKRTSESRGVVLMLSAGIFAAASNTGVRAYIHSLAPFYVLLLVFAVRSFTRNPAPRPPLVALRAAVMLGAVAFGFVMVQSVTAYENRLTSWAVEVLGSRRMNRGNEVGLSGTPRLGAVRNPKPSMERVLLIDGPRGERHLRAIVFDVFDGRAWKPALRERGFVPIDAQSLRTPEPGQRLTFTRIGETLDVLPMPPNTARVEAVRGLDRDDLSTVRDQETALVGAASKYAVVAPSNERFQGPLLRRMDDGQRQRALALPEDLNPRVIDLAKQIAGDGDPHVRLLRISSHLRSNHAYSLSFEPDYTDPLSDFILNRRAAHCQYFASAMVVMARAVGVPARFVTGYYGHEPYGEGQTVVRQRDAHAWAECWVDGVGWLTLDATPAGGIPDEMFQAASKGRRIWERITDLPGVLRDWVAQFSRRTLVTVIIAGAALVLAASVVRFLLARRRSRLARVAEYEQPDDEQILAAAERFDRWMRRSGRACAANRTWREHVAPLDPKCLEFVDVYDVARFGGADGELIPRMRTLLDELESQPNGGVAHG